MDEYSDFLESLLTSTENEAKKMFNEWIMDLARKPEKEGIEEHVRFLKAFNLRTNEEQTIITELAASYVILNPDNSLSRVSPLFKKVLSITTAEIQKPYVGRLPIKILEEVIKEKGRARDKLRRIAEFVAVPEVRAIFQELYHEETEHETNLKKTLEGLKLLNEFEG
jgi:hypothetical protein